MPAEIHTAAVFMKSYATAWNHDFNLLEYVDTVFDFKKEKKRPHITLVPPPQVTDNGWAISEWLIQNNEGEFLQFTW